MFSNGNSVIYIAKGSVTLVIFQMHRIWLSTMYIFCCSANSSFLPKIYFNNNNIAQGCDTKNIYKLLV